MLACGIAGLTYVILQNGFGGTSIKALVMALAYGWGLILAIYLMGHGLVAVPRRLRRNADIGGRLKRLQSQAPKIHERLADANVELEELEGQVAQLRQRKNGISRDHQEWIEDIVDVSTISSARVGSRPAPDSRSATIPAVVTDRYLAELTRKLARARHKRVRFVDAWDRLIQEAADTQAILDSSASKQLDFGKASPDGPFYDRLTILTPYTRYLLYTHVIPSFRRASGALFAMASISIVWSEMIKFVAPQLSIISLTVIYRRGAPGGSINFGGQLIASCWILYMCTAALASFDEIKVWGNRSLTRRNTYGESACWYSGQIAKLTVPLAYNFITFLPKETREKTTFYQFLGRLINLTPLGKGFDYFFPIFILIPVCATLFNLYGRVKGIFGFGVLEDDDEENQSGFGTGGWREGRTLIEAELNNASGLRLSGTLDGAHSPTRPGQNAPDRRIAAQPTTPPIQRPIPQSSRPPIHQTPTAQRQAERLAAATQAAEEEDENIFQGFAHRVKNTLDSVERPEWLPDFGKRPKWMGGVEGNQERSGRADAGRGVGSWFGGRPADGRVRL